MYDWKGSQLSGGDLTDEKQEKNKSRWKEN